MPCPIIYSQINFPPTLFHQKFFNPGKSGGAACRETAHAFRRYPTQRIHGQRAPPAPSSKAQGPDGTASRMTHRRKDRREQSSVGPNGRRPPQAGDGVGRRGDYPVRALPTPPCTGSTPRHPFGKMQSTGAHGSGQSRVSANQQPNMAAPAEDGQLPRQGNSVPDVVVTQNNRAIAGQGGNCG